MKNLGKVVVGLVFLLCTSVSVIAAQSVEENPFIGRWKATVFETTEGDVDFILEFVFREGKLVGTIENAENGTKTNLSSIEADEESIEFGFFSESRSIELTYYLEIVDEGEAEGYLLDMFEVEAKKIKEKKKK